MPKINITSNQFTFDPRPISLPDWETVSNERWNELIAQGWTPTEYIFPYRVSKDTIMSRVLEAGKVSDLMAVIAALSAEDQFLWTNYAWFWNTNQTAISICQQLGLDPVIVLAPDPYLS